MAQLVELLDSVLAIYNKKCFHGASSIVMLEGKDGILKGQPTERCNSFLSKSSSQTRSFKYTVKIWEGSRDSETTTR